MNPTVKKKFNLFLICVIFLIIPTGCGVFFENDTIRGVLTRTDVYIIEYHIERYMADMEEFTRRLYLRNPKYEIDLAAREIKINRIFHRIRRDDGIYSYMSSNDVLTAAFAPETEGDRVYLLGLGLVRSIEEAYGFRDRKFLLWGLQIPLKFLERLHFNISQVNWRLKTYKDEKGDFIFLTFGIASNGYVNMGYEVIMTRILTRIEDDIYMHGGLPKKYAFDVATFFLSIVI